jgi:hypothetical protein
MPTKLEPAANLPGIGISLGTTYTSNYLSGEDLKYPWIFTELSDNIEIGRQLFGGPVGKI